MKRLLLETVLAAALTACVGASAMAGDLLAKANAGEAVRIGFANEVPWAYPGDGDAPKGFVNSIALGVLDKMGITNIEPVVTDWGGLIPGLNANRFDVITGGMYILGSRCENVDFSEPIGVFGDAFIVAKVEIRRPSRPTRTSGTRGPFWSPAPATTSSRSPRGKALRTTT